LLLFANVDDGGDTSSSTGSRYHNIPLVEKLDTPIAVPPLQKVHADWEAFFAYLKVYQKETSQAIRNANTVSVAVRNREISRTVAAQRGMHVQFVPLSWGTYKRTFICTHGWKERVRGGGVRTMQFYRGSGCPLRIVATVSQVDGKWVVLITGEVLFHNHRVGPEVFKTYAENRGIKDPANKAKAEGMIENQRKPKAILNELLEKGENVTLKDVENLVQLYKNEVKNEDDDTACLALLSEFTASHDNNSVSVDETSHHETGVISMTSAFMTEMMSRFDEILLVDCTHKTNR
jgi:hypothetical protein